MQSFHILYLVIYYAKEIILKKHLNFMQRIPKKEIGQLFENGHF